MSEPLSAAELDDLAAKLSRSGLPTTPGPGSNVAYVSKEEKDRLFGAAIASGLGRFRVSEHDHRMALERNGRAQR